MATDTCMRALGVALNHDAVRELAALREENASLQATRIDPADTLLVAIIDLVHREHAAGFGATDVMPSQFHLAADDRFVNCLYGQQSVLCWVDDYGNTYSVGDFQRLVQKLCAMGLQVVVLEPMGSCGANGAMKCPFTLEWNERARSGLPQALPLWPQAVHHHPTGPLTWLDSNPEED